MGEGTRPARDIILLLCLDIINAHSFVRVFPSLWTECSQQTRVRKEGREGERERGRGDELFEAERVVKL